MSDPNENKPGYKPTKVGWIPEEWADPPLCKVATIQTCLAKGKNGLREQVTCPYLRVATPVADIVFKAFDWMEEHRGWTVHALTVMPNHVHTVLRNTEGRNDQLNKDLGVLKGFTARECNRVLECTGRPFWMDENFDHWIRHDGKLLSAVRYTATNPVKAGLVPNRSDWPWTRVGQAFLPDLEEAISSRALLPDPAEGECQAGMPDLLETRPGQ